MCFSEFTREVQLKTLDTTHQTNTRADSDLERGKAGRRGGLLRPHGGGSLGFLFLVHPRLGAEEAGNSDANRHQQERALCSQGTRKESLARQRTFGH